MALALAPFLLLLMFLLIFFWPAISRLSPPLPANYLSEFYPWREELSGKREGYPAWDALLYDGLGQYYPWRRFLGESVRQGFIPLWNPYMFCGTPFLANVQSAVLYPLNFLFCLRSTEKAFLISLLLHLLLAGFFMYLYSRNLNLKRFPALLAATLFMFNGFFITRLALPTYINVGTWLPLAFLLADKSIRKESLPYSALLGFVLGIQFLAGHFQISLYLLLALFLYYIYLIFLTYKDTKNPKFAIKLLSLFALSLIIGFSLAAPQILPALEFSKYSHRSAPRTWDTFFAYNKGALPWRNLITFVMPDFFGNPVKGDYLRLGPYDNYIEFCGFLGLLPLILAIVAAFFQRNRYAYFFIFLTIFSLLLALGTLLGALLFFLIPGVSQMGMPSRILLIYVFSVSVLAGFGADCWLREPKRIRRSILCIGGFLLALAILGCYSLWRYVISDQLLSPLGLREFIVAEKDDFLRFVAFLFLSCLAIILPTLKKFGLATAEFLILVFAFIDLWVFGTKFVSGTHRNLYPSTPAINFLSQQKGLFRIMPLNRDWRLDKPPQAILPPNSAMVYRLFDVQGYDSLYLRDYKAFLTLIEGKDPSPLVNGNIVFLTNYQSQLVHLLNVKYIMTCETIKSKNFKEVYKVGDFRIYENKGSLPRAFLVHKIKLVHGPIMVLKELLNDSFEPKDYIICSDDHPRIELPKLWKEPPIGEATPEILQYSPNQVIMQANLKAPGFLVLSEVCYPGWKVYVDGEADELICADGIFRAVFLGKGTHQVKFIYQPLSFRIGLYISLLTLLCSAALFACPPRQAGL